MSTRDETIETTSAWEVKVPLGLLILGLAILVIHGLAMQGARGRGDAAGHRAAAVDLPAGPDRRDVHHRALVDVTFGEFGPAVLKIARIYVFTSAIQDVAATTVHPALGWALGLGASLALFSKAFELTFGEGRQGGLRDRGRARAAGLRDRVTAIAWGPRRGPGPAAGRTSGGRRRGSIGTQAPCLESRDRRQGTDQQITKHVLRFAFVGPSSSREVLERPDLDDRVPVEDVLGRGEDDPGRITEVLVIMGLDPRVMAARLGRVDARNRPSMVVESGSSEPSRVTRFTAPPRTSIRAVLSPKARPLKGWSSKE